MERFGSHLILPVGLQQQSSRGHGGNLEDILTDQRNFLKQLVAPCAEDPNSVHLSNQNALILYGEPVIKGQGSRMTKDAMMILANIFPPLNNETNILNRKMHGECIYKLNFI